MPHFEIHFDNIPAAKTFDAGLFDRSLNPMAGAKDAESNLIDGRDISSNPGLVHRGAKALPPMNNPGIGRAAYVEDGRGNVVGMITPAEST